MMKSYTDLSQSKVLAKILPLESADFMWEYKPDKEIYWDKPTVIPIDSYIFINDIPCWSLAALLDILPILERKGYQKAKPQLLYNVAINKWIVDSHIYTTDAYDNPVDACYEMVLELYGLNFL